MKKRIVILGAGGHGRVVADAALLCGYQEVIFLDDAADASAVVAGKTDSYKDYIDACDFFVAIGNNAIREKMTSRLIDDGANVVAIVHPSAVIGSRVQIARGAFVAPGAVVNTGTEIGLGAILNTCCSVDHDCTVEDYCHISVGSHLAGTVSVGKGTFVGAGATVINNLSVCADCVIGAGAVVVKSIAECGTYVGVPAKKIKNGSKERL